MARRVSWTNNSSGHSGTYVYRAPTLDPSSLAAPVATVDPVAQGETAEWLDTDYLAPGDYEYAAQDFSGVELGPISIIAFSTPDPDADALAAASVGDYVAGGIFAGTDTIDGQEYYIVAGVADSDVQGLQWFRDRVLVPGTESLTDGLANTLAMEANDRDLHQAAAYCLDYRGGGYSDWHMPARSQMALIASNLSSHPDFAWAVIGTNFHFSSSESSAVKAWGWRISDNLQAELDKNSTGSRTRPIRRVPV